MSADQPTPEFLAWCLVTPCPLRPDESLADPLRTERLLKSLRATRQAELEGRVVSGICLDQATAHGTATTPMGFPRDEILRRFRGVQRIEHACGRCPANIDTPSDHSNTPTTIHWAGCFGWVVLDATLAQLPSAVHTALTDIAQDRHLQSLPPRIAEAITSRPQPSVHREQPEADKPVSQVAPCIDSALGFRALGLAGEIQGDWLETLADHIDRWLDDHLPTNSMAGDDLGSQDPRRWPQALRRAATHGLSIAHQLIPAGEVRGRDWWWPRRCSECLSARNDNTTTCHVCGSKAAPLPPLKRKTRGTRPFLSLEKVLGPEAAQSILRQQQDKHLADRDTVEP